METNTEAFTITSHTCRVCGTEVLRDEETLAEVHRDIGFDIKCGVPAVGPLDTELIAVADLLPMVDPGADDDSVDGYADAMREGKWDGSSDEEPVHIGEWANGVRVLIDGSHRVLAASRAGVTHLPVFTEPHTTDAPDWALRLVRTAR